MVTNYDIFAEKSLIKFLLMTELKRKARKNFYTKLNGNG